MFDKKTIFIPGHVPSLKNSKVKTSRGIFYSKTVKKYLQKLGIQRFSSSKKIVIGYKTRQNEFAKLLENFNFNYESPLVVGFHFVRSTKHKFDFHNAVQIVADLLVAHDFIEDDNMDYFIPVPFKMNKQWYSYDKENPGVYLKIYNKQ